MVYQFFLGDVLTRACSMGYKRGSYSLSRIVAPWLRSCATRVTMSCALTRVSADRVR